MGSARGSGAGGRARGTNFNEGLTEDGITDASSIVEIDNVFFVGSNGQGVYRSEPLTTAISYVEPQRGTFRVTQNFPNPFTDETSIPVILDEMNEVNITIFDQTGRLVSQVFQGQLGSGRHLFTVDAHHNNMTPGSYYCTVKTNDQTATMKMVVVH